MSLPLRTKMALRIFLWFILFFQ